ncbi:MAG: NCS2 family permease, partial [Clostridia bacterium]|nr:NCS2 family permease [Clostridia bacterium]
MDKFFKLKERGTDVKTEIIAGLTTFLAMAYILAVNPGYFEGLDGVSKAAIFSATAISAAIATLCMAFLANYPVALASGMGLNAFFVFTVCGAMGCSYEVALTAVLVEGIIFILLSLCNFREALVNQIPANLKFGITAGIGLFITIIALLGSGVVVQDPATTVAIGNFSSPQFVLSLVGLLVIAVLHHYKVPGSILLGILITWVLGIIAELTGWYVVDVEAEVYSVIPSFSFNAFEAPHMFRFDFSYVVKNLSSFAVIVFTFLFTDIFDTVGTLIGVAEKGKLLNEKGELPQAKGELLADAIGTVVGACLGTSTVTSYVESSAGVSAGGRTGLSSVVTAIMFILSLVFAPIFLAIPSFATTPAMVFVGLLMFGAVKNIDFESDMADSIGAFVAIAFMPLTYSISNGIMFGMLSWVIVKIFTGKIKDVKAIMWVSTALFAIYFILKFLG